MEDVKYYMGLAYSTKNNNDTYPTGSVVDVEHIINSLSSLSVDELNSVIKHSKKNIENIQTDNLMEYINQKEVGNE